MAEEKLKTTEFLFKKIKSLYPTFDYPDEIDIECWTEVLQGNSQETILKALKAYRKTVEYNQAPTPGTFARFLREEKVYEPQVTDLDKALDDPKDWRTFWNIDPALAYYLRDCATMSSEKVHALLFYRRALADIIALNVNTLPNAGKMNYAEKVAIVRRNGWDADITEKAGEMALEAKGQNPESVKQALNALASHWRVGK